MVVIIEIVNLFFIRSYGHLILIIVHIFTMVLLLFMVLELPLQVVVRVMDTLFVCAGYVELRLSHAVLKSYRVSLLLELWLAFLILLGLKHLVLIKELLVMRVTTGLMIDMISCVARFLLRDRIIVAELRISRYYAR